MLANLLATYSDEKVKKIKLSIQEKQDVSREEVERSLRRSGLRSVANGLKDSIEKGMLHYWTRQLTKCCNFTANEKYITISNLIIGVI